MVPIQTTPLQAAISRFEDKNLTRFKPDARLYERLGINQFRFWKIVRGELDATGPELKALAAFFGCEVSELI